MKRMNDLGRMFKKRDDTGKLDETRKNSLVNIKVHLVKG